MPVSMRLKVDACIFDCDGLLLNTEDIYYEIECSVLARFGKTFTWELNRRMMGMKWPDAASLVIKELDLPVTIDEYYTLSNELHHRFIEARLLPGVDRLVRSLKEQQVPLAVASSSLSSSFKLKTTRHGEFFALFDAVVLGDDPMVARGKPCPDIFLAAASRIAHRMPLQKRCPSRILAFEDSPNGVVAARAAGMPVIWIPSPHIDPHQFDADPLVFRLGSMTEFSPAEFGLPALAKLH